jgi:predicted RNA-binding Zn-ribbon protein involved in translation (DUF1610 family)
MSKDDYPLDECAATLQRLVENGATFWQKFTCANCGERKTMDVPNVLYTAGHCDSCGHLTNIEETGCNYLLLTVA